MGKPRIAIFIDWYLPAYKAGGPVKSVSSIVQQFKNELDFYIITSDRDFGDTQPFKNVKINEWNDVEGAKVIYLSPTQQTPEQYIKRIAEIEPQKIYFNSLFSQNFTLTPLKTLKKEYPEKEYIVAPRGMLGAGALKIKRAKKMIFLKLANLLGWFKGVTWHASTEQEQNEIHQHFGKTATVKVAENLGQVPEAIDRSKKSTAGHLKMIFVSRVSTKKNLLFALECLNTPDLKDHVSLSVVGPMEDQAYGEECVNYCKSNQLKVEFLGGKSPQELKELYASHDVFILPTHHENYGHVVIESLAHGTPVLISEHTPWRNLKVVNVGFDLPLEHEAFRQQINYFLNLANEDWSTHAQAAHEFAKRQVNSETAVHANENLFLS